MNFSINSLGRLSSKNLLPFVRPLGLESKSKNLVVIALMAIAMLTVTVDRLVDGAERDVLHDPSTNLFHLTVEGEIKKGDVEKLIYALQKVEGEIVDDKLFLIILHLNSPGGDVLEAMKMVEILRLLRMPMATVEGECNSACFFLLATAESKVWEDDDIVGIHRPSLLPEYLVGLSPSEAESLHEEVTTTVTQILTELNVPADLIEEIILKK